MTQHLALTLNGVGIFFTKPVALDESAHASTIASSSGSVMNDIENESNFDVSSFDVAILRTSIRFEFRLDIKYRWPLLLTIASSLPDGEKAAHCIRLPSLPWRLEISVLISLLCPSSGWTRTGTPDWVQVVIHIKLSPHPDPDRKIADDTPLSSDSCRGT
jgi:hypothetical protein